MKIKKVIKGSLISLAILGMIGGSINNVQARRYHHYHHTRHYKRTIYKYGYWKYGRYHYYKTGYFRNGKWIRRYTPKSHQHHQYMWIGYSNNEIGGEKEPHYARVQIIKKTYPVGYTKDPDGIMYYYRTKDKNFLKAYKKVMGHKFTMDQDWGNGFFTHKPTTPIHHKLPYHINNINNTDNDSTPSANDNSNDNPDSTDNNSTADNLAEMKSQTLTDINNDRAAYHENPLQEDPGLDEVAGIRAKQAQTNFSHYDPNNGGRMYELEVADQTGHSLDNTASAENLAFSQINIEETRSDGSSYYDHNGTDAANDINNSFMNHDTSSNPSTNWGHRKNILGNYNWIGVGTSKDSQGNYYIAEDFADANPSSTSNQNNNEVNDSNYSYSYRPINNSYHGAYAYASGGAGGRASIVHGGYARGGSGGAGGVAVAVA